MVDPYVLLRVLDAGDGLDSRLLLLGRLRRVVLPLLEGSQVVWDYARLELQNLATAAELRAWKTRSPLYAARSVSTPACIVSAETALNAQYHMSIVAIIRCSCLL